MATSRAKDLCTLKQHLASIPQELYDEIFNLILAPTSATVTFSEKYKPPHQLQLSRATRRKAAERYYNTTIFQLNEGGGREDLWLRWLMSLTQEHVPMIHNTYFKSSRKRWITDWDHAMTQAYWDTEALWTLACCQGTPIGPECIFTNVEYQDRDGTFKEVWKDGSFLISKWIEGDMPMIFNRRNFGDQDDQDDEGDEEDEEDENDMCEPVMGRGEDDFVEHGTGGDGGGGGAVEGGTEKHESDHEDDSEVTSRFASTNPFDLLAD